MLRGQTAHEHLKTALALGAGRLQQVLHQLEHGYDVAALLHSAVDFFWGQEFRQQEDHGGEESCGGIVEKGVLAVAAAVPVRADDGLGEDLGVLLRLCPRRQIIRVLHRLIHVGVCQSQKVEPVRAGRITQVDDGYLIAIVFFRDGSIVPSQIALGVQSQKAHPAGAGVFQIGIEEKGRLAHARRADHQTVDVVAGHQGGDIALLPLRAEHQPLYCGKIFSLTPLGGVERYAVEGLSDLLGRGPAGGAMLTIAHGFGLDAVQ